jgi:hypothetical protein
MTIAYQYLPFIFGIYLVPPRSQTPIHLTNGLVMVGTNAPLRPTADIIFVHGLGSLPDSTWHKPLPGQKTKYPEGVHWVRDLLPSDIPDARLMFFNYDSTVYNDAPQKSLRTIGDELLLALEHSKADASAWQQEIPIIFVCHSFGGLVVKEALRAASTKARASVNTKRVYTNPLQHTWGSIFLGTPHRGTDYWWLCYLIALFFTPNGSNPKLYQQLRPGLEDLVQLHEDFLRNHPHIKVINFYETRRQPISEHLGKFSPAIIIVSEESATDNSTNMENHSLDYNHSGLNKYNSKTDLGYVNIVAKLKGMLETITEDEFASGRRKADLYEAIHQIQNAMQTPRCNTEQCKLELASAYIHLVRDPVLLHQRIREKEIIEIDKMADGWWKTVYSWLSLIKYVLTAPESDSAQLERMRRERNNEIHFF